MAFGEGVREVKKNSGNVAVVSDARSMQPPDKRNGHAMRMPIVAEPVSLTLDVNESILSAIMRSTSQWISRIFLPNRRRMAETGVAQGLHHSSNPQREGFHNHPGGRTLREKVAIGTTQNTHLSEDGVRNGEIIKRRINNVGITETAVPDTPAITRQFPVGDVPMHTRSLPVAVVEPDSSMRTTGDMGRVAHTLRNIEAWGTAKRESQEATLSTPPWSGDRGFHHTHSRIHHDPLSVESDVVEGYVAPGRAAPPNPHPKIRPDSAVWSTEQQAGITSEDRGTMGWGAGRTTAHTWPANLAVHGLEGDRRDEIGMDRYVPSTRRPDHRNPSATTSTLLMDANNRSGMTIQTSSMVGIRGSADSESGNVGNGGNEKRWMGPPRPSVATKSLRVGAPTSGEFPNGAELREAMPPWMRLPTTTRGVSAARVDDQAMGMETSRGFAARAGNDHLSLRSAKSSDAGATTGSVVWTNVRDQGLENGANQRSSVASGGTVSTRAEEVGLASDVRERGLERHDPRPSIRNVASSQAGAAEPITSGLAMRGGAARQSDPHPVGGVSFHVVSTATEEASARMASVKATLSTERSATGASVVATARDAMQTVAWHAPSEPDGVAMRRPDRDRASWERSSPWENQPTDMRRTDAQASTAQSAGRRWLPGV